MRSYITAVIWLILCISCSEQEKHVKPRVYSFPNTRMDSVALILSNASSINGPTVGVSGMKTREYDSYEWLQKSGSDSLLIELVGYSNPYTKTYAFMALCKRKSPVTRELFIKNIKDTTTLILQNGCFGSVCKLNQVWLAKIHPLLDSTESLSFARKIHKDYPRMTLCMMPD